MSRRRERAARYFNRISWYPEAVLLAVLMGRGPGRPVIARGTAT